MKMYLITMGVLMSFLSCEFDSGSGVANNHRSAMSASTGGGNEYVVNATLSL